MQWSLWNADFDLLLPVMLSDQFPAEQRCG